MNLTLLFSAIWAKLMFKSPTMFVIGAGASKELGLPLGDELKMRIAEAITFKNTGYGIDGGNQCVRDSILSAIREDGFSQSKLMDAAQKIAAALELAISIDNYLEVNEGDKEIEFCSKLAIAAEIGKAENESGLFSGSCNNGRLKKKVDYDRLSKTWLMPLIRFLTENVNRGTIDSVFSRVKFIIFNYDRCVEQFLFNALQRYYNMSAEESGTVLSRATFHHVYGSNGKLPWQVGDAHGGLINLFGNIEWEYQILPKVSAGIKTFSETIDREHHSWMSSDLQESENVVFLGFGFLEQNMRILELLNRSNIKRVFATALGFSDSDCKVISYSIRNALKMDESSTVELRNDLTASGLFGEYSRSITQ